MFLEGHTVLQLLIVGFLWVGDLPRNFSNFCGTNDDEWDFTGHIGQTVYASRDIL